MLYDIILKVVYITIYHFFQFTKEKITTYIKINNLFE